MTQFSAWIDGIGCLGPGLADWPTTARILQGQQAYQSQPTTLPPPFLLTTAERRRASRAICLTLGVGHESVTAAQADAATLPTVFVSSHADGQNCNAILTQLASTDRQISPTRFHNSVHNAPPGYWHIATGSMASSQVLAAYDSTFAAGLLEALCQLQCDAPRLLLVAYDSAHPEPMHSKRPIADAGAIALVLNREQTERSLARLQASITRDAPDSLPEPTLEKLRHQIPALSGLLLLWLLARRIDQPRVLEYQPPLNMRMALSFA